MLADALIFLIKTVFGLFTMALLLRFYMQWARAAYRNPLSDFLAALTDFVVRPARRVVPGLWGTDLATVALAWAVQVIELALVLHIDAPPLTAGTGAILDKAHQVTRILDIAGNGGGIGDFLGQCAQG